MSIEYQLSMMQRVQGLHTFLVEPIRPFIGTYMNEPPWVFVSEGIETVEEAVKELGKLIEFRKDGSAIIEQSSSVVAKEEEDEFGETQSYLTKVDKPMVWRMRVSKTELKFHTPSIRMFSNE